MSKIIPKIFVFAPFSLEFYLNYKVSIEIKAFQGACEPCLMDGAQSGTRAGCSTTVDNLLIDWTETLDCHWWKRNYVSDLDESNHHKLLGVLETVRQEERMSL